MSLIRIGIFCSAMILLIPITGSVFIYQECEIGTPLNEECKIGITILIATVVSFTGVLTGFVMTRESNDKIMSKLIEIENTLDLVKPVNSGIDPSQNLDVRSIPKYIFAMSAIHTFAGNHLSEMYSDLDQIRQKNPNRSIKVRYDNFCCSDKKPNRAAI